MLGHGSSDQGKEVCVSGCVIWSRANRRGSRCRSEHALDWPLPSSLFSLTISLSLDPIHSADELREMFNVSSEAAPVDEAKAAQE